MAKILEDVQSKFVPTVDINGEPRVVQQVFLDGDQLTEERARNAQLANARQRDQLNVCVDWRLRLQIGIYAKTF